MRKHKLLAKMAELHACREATDWVTAHPSDDAAVIWRECQRVDWAIWFMGRVRPRKVAVFARRCADRARANAAAYAAANYAAAYAAAAAAYAAARADAAYAAAAARADAAYAAAAAHSAASAAASAAAYSATSAADAADDAERAAQLAELRAWADSWSDKT